MNTGRSQLRRISSSNAGLDSSEPTCSANSPSWSGVGGSEGKGDHLPTHRSSSHARTIRNTTNSLSSFRRWDFRSRILLCVPPVTLMFLIPTLVILQRGEAKTLYPRPLLDAPLDNRTHFTLIIDAGSSGSRLHVFRYTVSTHSSALPRVFPASPSLKIRPGLSFYATSPESAGASLAPLLEFARIHIPTDIRSQTPLYLMATAGLRLVPQETADAILQSCRVVIEGSGFKVDPTEGAAVISGTAMCLLLRSGFGVWGLRDQGMSLWFQVFISGSRSRILSVPVLV